MGIEDFKDTQPKFLPYSGTEPVLEGRALGEQAGFRLSLKSTRDVQNQMARQQN